MRGGKRERGRRQSCVRGISSSSSDVRGFYFFGSCSMMATAKGKRGHEHYPLFLSACTPSHPFVRARKNLVSVTGEKKERKRPQALVVVYELPIACCICPLFLLCLSLPRLTHCNEHVVTHSTHSFEDRRRRRGQQQQQKITPYPLWDKQHKKRAPISR